MWLWLSKVQDSRTRSKWLWPPGKFCLGSAYMHWASHYFYSIFQIWDTVMEVITEKDGHWSLHEEMTPGLFMTECQEIATCLEHVLIHFLIWLLEQCRGRCWEHRISFPFPGTSVLIMEETWQSHGAFSTPRLSSRISVAKCTWTLETCQEKLGKATIVWAHQKDGMYKFRLCVVSRLGRLCHLLQTRSLSK